MNSYQQTKKRLLCPVRPKKTKVNVGPFKISPDGELIYSMDGLYGNYAANYRLGGSWGLWSVRGLTDTQVANPAGTIHIVDGGTAPTNTKDPDKCVTDTSLRKPGCWIVHLALHRAADSASQSLTPPLVCRVKLQTLCGFPSPRTL